MTEHEIRGRLVVLEVVCMSALALLFTLTSASDPEHEKAITLLDALRVAAKRRLGEASDPAIVAPGEAYLDELSSTLSESLGLLRPEPKEP